MTGWNQTVLAVERRPERSEGCVLKPVRIALILSLLAKPAIGIEARRGETHSGSMLAR